ncbi:hypothetical protein HN011_011622 [Eciton burchellii]|nr:hypothetical protein HN011_011622 [Eciton burchellii]
MTTMTVRLCSFTATNVNILHQCAVCLITTYRVPVVPPCDFPFAGKSVGGATTDFSSSFWSPRSMLTAV